jgi:hypothetical protein
MRTWWTDRAPPLQYGRCCLQIPQVHPPDPKFLNFLLLRNGFCNRRFWGSSRPPPTGKPIGKGGGLSQWFPGRRGTFRPPKTDDFRTEFLNMKNYGPLGKAGEKVRAEGLRTLSRHGCGGTSKGVGSGRCRHKNTSRRLLHKHTEQFPFACTRGWHLGGPEKHRNS